MKKTLTLFAASVLAISLHAATYYASPNGLGDGSSYFSPTTFAQGVAALHNGGDTLYLLEGTYEFTDKFSINKKGSAAKRIVISGYPGEKVLLDFHRVPYGTRGITVHAEALYVHIKDLAIAWSGKNNLYCEGSYCLFERLDIYGSADTGCQMKKGGNNVILNVDSHDNFDYETMSGATANFGGNADGFADKQFSGAGNRYIGCRAWNNSDDGWDFFQRVSSSNTVIENCVCYANGAPYYDMSRNPRALTTDKSRFDSKVGTTMTDRYGNTITITLDRYPCQGNGNGFKMGGQYTDHKIIVHHCLAVGNYARGYDQNNNGGTMWLYNNSAYDNYVNYGFTTAYGTNTLRNNVSLSSRNGDSYKSKNVAANDHNTWNGTGCSAADFQSLDTTQILAPRQANGSLAEGTFMRLASGSALIDAGIDVNLGYNGAAPDLGCYESPGEHHDPLPDDTIPDIQPEGSHAIAFVTIQDALEDKPLLSHLRANDSLWIVTTDATDPETDYSGYEVIVIGSKPASSSPGLSVLKGYNKPIVLLKPWLLKQGVWSWGTAINTPDLNIAVSEPGHPLFDGLSITDGQLPLFSQCNSNAVTAISEWTNTTGFTALASPVSTPDATTVAELPAGTDCNGTVLPQPMIMIGVSEYSTTYLTDQGKRLIENAILYLLGVRMPEGLAPHPTTVTYHKYIQDGKLYIQAGSTLYDATGRALR